MRRGIDLGTRSVIGSWWDPKDVDWFGLTCGCLLLLGGKRELGGRGAGRVWCGRRRKAMRVRGRGRVYDEKFHS